MLPMDIIPVIDLKSGQVVHARGGRRDDYRPIETPLSKTSAPADVVGGLLRRYAFSRIYVADLDAIARVGDHEATLRALMARFPDLEFWVDNGAASGEFLGRHTGSLVVGSESQTSTSVLRSLRDNPRVVLSLDFRGDAFQGPPDILADPGLWPARIIVMTLGRVGSAAGPDLARIGAVARRAAGRSVYAAGGVRNAQDLDDAAAAGAAGALVATALHSGTLIVPPPRTGDG